MPVLFAFREDRFGFRFEVGERAVLGRSPECELILFDQATSRYHAEISKSDEGYFLNDLGSTNGTFHNEAPVNEPVLLKKNDEIKVGQEIFLFDPDLDVAVGREGVVLIAGEVEADPEGLVTHSAKPDMASLNRVNLAPLFKVAMAMAKRPQFSRSLKQAAYAVGKLLGATRMALLWPESAAAERLTAILVRPVGQRGILPRPLVDLVLGEGRAVLWPFILTELTFNKGERTLMDAPGPAMAVPLDTQSHSRGLLYIESRTRTYTEKDLNFMTALADLISSALLSAHLIGQIDHRLTREEEELRSGSDFIGEDKTIKTLLATAAQVALTDARILITGEMGTGKEVLAKRIHALSPRRRASFIFINCAALPQGRIESALFGQEAGTLAEEGTAGLLEEADGGMVFFQNVDHLPLSVQVDLLRTIEEGVIYRVGSSRPRPINFRVVSSSNVDLGPLVENEEFREDLFHRLSEVTLDMPPLREIKDDIIVLTRHFLAQAARERGIPVPQLDPGAAECLRAYPWPGNVSELENLVKTLVMFSTGDKIFLDDLPQEIRLFGEAFQTAEGERAPDSLIEVEKTLIRRALARTRGDAERAAQILGLNPTELEQQITRYDIALDQTLELVITGTDN